MKNGVNGSNFAADESIAKKQSGRTEIPGFARTMLLARRYRILSHGLVNDHHQDFNFIELPMLGRIKILFREGRSGQRFSYALDLADCMCRHFEFRRTTTTGRCEYVAPFADHGTTDFRWPIHAGGIGHLHRRSVRSVDERRFGGCCQAVGLMRSMSFQLGSTGPAPLRAVWR
jgi:hypothetical protein